MSPALMTMAVMTQNGRMINRRSRPTETSPQRTQEAMSWSFADTALMAQSNSGPWRGTANGIIRAYSSLRENEREPGSRPLKVRLYLMTRSAERRNLHLSRTGRWWSKPASRRELRRWRHRMSLCPMSLNGNSTMLSQLKMKRWWCPRMNWPYG